MARFDPLFDDDHKKRKGFSTYVKILTVVEQENRCDSCNRSFSKTRMPQFHHKNGNNMDNSEDNCAALHADCHDGIERKNNQNRNKENKNNFGNINMNTKWI